MSDEVAMKYVGGHVPAELADRFKQLAEDHDRAVAAELRRALRRHVDACAAGADDEAAAA